MPPDSTVRSQTLRWGRGEWGLLALCLLLFFWRLGGVPIIDYDEALYVTCAQQMTLNNDFVTPRLNTRLVSRPQATQVAFFEKPILVYWASASSMRLFGRNTFAARLPVALAALLTTMAVAGAGRKWFGRNAGLIAGVVYATAPMTVVDARQMTTDGLLILWFTLALFAFRRIYRAVTHPASSPLSLASALFFWLMCALAVLTKGIVGLLLPFLVIGVFVLDLRRASGLLAGLPVRLRWNGRRTLWPILRGLRPLPGLLLFLAVVAPWHLQIAQRHERDSQNRTWVQEYIVRQHIGRFKGLDKVHNSPPYINVAYFLIGFLPWSCFAPAAFRQRKGEKRGAEDREKEAGTEETEETETHRFLLVWFWAIFVFFSIGAAKLPTYITPAYPAAALLVGKWLAQITNRSSQAEAETESSSTAKHTADLDLRSLQRGALAACITGLLLLLVAFIGPQFAPARAPIAPAIAQAARHLGLLLTLGPLVALICFGRRQAAQRAKIGGLTVLAGTMVLLTILLCTEGYAVGEQFALGPYQQLSRLARPDAKTGLPIVYYNVVPHRPSMNFYAGYAPIETKESPLLPTVRPFLNPAYADMDVLTTRETFEQQLRPEIQATPGASVQMLATRGLHDDWVLLRIHAPM